MNEVPYSTSNEPGWDESQPCGDIWRQRRADLNSPWGFAWAVYPPYSDEEPSASGWRPTQEQAEEAMHEEQPHAD